MSMGIYKITCLPTGKCYIGKGSDANKRYSDHRNKLKRNNHYNPYFQNAWIKYGAENFVFEIIELIEEEKHLIEREIHWIKEYGSYDRKLGFNMTTGGDGLSGLDFSEEHRAKLSKINIGNKNAVGYTHSESAKKIMRAKKAGKKLRLGSTTSDITKQKLRECNINKKLSEETRSKMSVSKTGSKSYQAKFTDDQIREIRILYKYKHVKQMDIVRMFDTNIYAINKIVNGKTYRNIIV